MQDRAEGEGELCYTCKRGLSPSHKFSEVEEDPSDLT